MKINAAGTSRLINMPYRDTLILLQTDVLKGEKIKGRWVVMSNDIHRFRAVNQKKIAQLKQKCIDMYWQGYSPEYLQKMAEGEFKSLGIQGKPKGFAEQAIVEDLLRLKREHSQA